MASLVHEQPLFLHPPADLLQRHPHLLYASRDLARKYASRHLVTEADLQAIGQQLWQVLDMDQAFDAARQAAGIEILPLVVASDDPAIHQLPWEILYHPKEDFLGKSNACTLSRRVPSAPASKRPPEVGPLRVLLFTSLPDDLDAERSRLDVEEEQAQVLEALMPWIAQGMVELDMPDDGRLTTLETSLREFQPHLLFLSGHGTFHQPLLPDDTPHATFLFENDHGEGVSVSEEEVARVFNGASVQCVVLSACESGKTASDALGTGLAQRLRLKGIPHVIGMRESIFDRAGILFARTFCDAVGHRERIDVALQLARQAITTPLADSTYKDSEASGITELSLGQWCLPMLLSQEEGRPLIDWDFTPQANNTPLVSDSLNTITLPPRFLGRRSELRRLQGRLRQGTLQQLLITGPGGQGKTALAGKLAKDRERQEAVILAWSAWPENSWGDFTLETELLLNKENAEKYDRAKERYTKEVDRARLLLRLLIQQFPHQVVLFLDNLESIQDAGTHQLTDPNIAAWIEAAQSLCGQGILLLLTSRWRLPGWPTADLLPLEHASYGDFLHMARFHKLDQDFLKNRDRLRWVYTTLHGNGRGLEFFVAAIQNMGNQEEKQFLATLAQTASDLQTNMALEQIHAHLNDEERELLRRLPAYHTPVPREGIIKLGLDLHPQPQQLLDRLLAVSLVEQQDAHRWEAVEYQCSPVVAEWLQEKQGVAEPDQEWLRLAADYQRYLFDQERRTLPQAMSVHQALLRAGEQEDANRWALAYIIRPLNRFGLYHTLIEEWLPPICASDDPQIRGAALNQTGTQYVHLGDHERALQFLNKALDIAQTIGNKAGEGTALNNIAQIYEARGDYERALLFLNKALDIAQTIGDKEGEGATLNNVSQIYHSRGDYERALLFLNKALDIAQAIGDKTGEEFSLNNISQIYKARGDDQRALLFLNKALDIAQTIGDKMGVGNTLNNIASIHHANGDDERALLFFNKALDIKQAIGDKAGEGNTLDNIASIHHANGDDERALLFLNKALNIRQAIGDKAGEGISLNNISQIYKARGDDQRALLFLTQSLDIQTDIGDVAGLCAALFNIGHFHVQNKDYQQALDAWLTVYQLARKSNLAQALDALEKLGKEGGLDFWERLLQQRSQNEEKNTPGAELRLGLH